MLRPGRAQRRDGTGIRELFLARIYGETLADATWPASAARFLGRYRLWIRYGVGLCPGEIRGALLNDLRNGSHRGWQSGDSLVNGFEIKCTGKIAYIRATPGAKVRHLGAKQGLKESEHRSVVEQNPNKRTHPG